MASENVLPWIADNLTVIKGDALEIGAKRYKEHAFIDLRHVIAEEGLQVPLTGTDLEAGENVDIVIDLCKPFAEVDKAFGGKRYDTMFCISVMEHIPDIFTAARNMAQLLKPKGALFLSVPFVFRYHGYPGDLWRFTPEAVRFLFPDFDFPAEGQTVTTLEKNDSFAYGNDVAAINKFIFRPKSKRERMTRKIQKRTGMQVDPYSLAPCMINMLGIKKNA